MTTPPAVGKTVSVKVDAQLYDDLQTMLATGMTVSDAVRSAMRIVAGTYRKTWEGGAVTQDVRPTITRFWITRYDPGQEPTRGSVQAAVPTAYRHNPTPHPTGVTARTTPRPTGLPPSHPILPTGTTEPAQRPTPVRPEGSWLTPQ
jgi:hypothetical protein